MHKPQESHNTNMQNHAKVLHTSCTTTGKSYTNCAKPQESHAQIDATPQECHTQIMHNHEKVRQPRTCKKTQESHTQIMPTQRKTHTTKIQQQRAHRPSPSISASSSPFNFVNGIDALRALRRSRVICSTCKTYDSMRHACPYEPNPTCVRLR